MWKKISRYLRLVYLLPLATAIHLKKTLGPKKLLACLLGLVCVIALVVGIAVSHGASQPPEPSPSPTMLASPSPSPSPTPEPPVSVTLSFAGDCTLGTDDAFAYDSSLPAAYDRNNAEYFFQNVRDIFAADDLTLVNLEGPLTTRGTREDKPWAFHGDPAYTGILTAGSVEAANLANNHAYDYGQDGYDDTVSALKNADIAFFGDNEHTIVEVGGVKIGLVGIYAVFEDEAHEAQLRDNIQSLRDQGAQLIVVSFHWGFEKDYDPEPDQVELAHLSIDLGADLVIGHHPHVLQPIECYKGKYIAYSLGNFCFGGNSNPPDYDAIIFQQTFTLQGGQVQSDDNIRVIPCSISSAGDYNNYCPTPASGDQRDRILDKLETLCAAYNFSPKPYAVP